MVNAVVNLLAWLVRRRRRVRVAGYSMVPTLDDGEFVLIDPARVPRAGDLVVAQHPRPSPDQASSQVFVVKRLTERRSDGRLILGSDNPAAGTDSRTWGPVDPSLIVGTVTVVLDRVFSSDLGPPSR